MLPLIGYWYCQEDPKLPDPSVLIDKNFWSKYPKEKIISYLKNGSSINHYLGFSGCRICDERLGTHEHTDGVYIWPEMMEHYIEVHDVILPEYFIKHIIRAKFKYKTVYKKYIQINTNVEPWRKWAVQNKAIVIHKFDQRSVMEQTVAKMAKEIEKEENRRMLREIQRQVTLLKHKPITRR